MKRIVFSLLLFPSLFITLGMPSVFAAELLSLQSRTDLWQQVQQGIHSPSHSLLASPQLQWVRVKTSSGSRRFEHYDTHYQGYPVLNGRVVLVIDSQGQLQQVMGAMATGLAEDLPDVRARFIQNDKVVELWLQGLLEGHQKMEALEILSAIFIDDTLAKAVYRISYRLINAQGITLQRPQMIVDAQTLQVLKQWDGLDRLKPRAAVAIEGQLIAAGGAGGNELLGLNCYSPSPDSMAQCLGYMGEDNPVITEVSFQNNNENNIYSEFSGYPFIVTQSGADCWLKNDYVTSIRADRDTPSDTAFQYSCDGSAEHFDKQHIDDVYYDFLSYFPINDAHFYAGVVMQMYDQYLHEIYPNQLEDCPSSDINSDYCLQPIKQRANAKGPTGADMGNANWDGQYINYGNGDYWLLYSQTTLDIVAHEISHGITDWNSDPERAGQSKALDESFSDIAAIAANDFFERHVSGSYASSLAYLNKREFSWVYGWDVFAFPGGGRDFQLPSRDGRSIGDARDYQQGMSGHSAGGVMNKLFYELVSRQGWSIEEAFKLMLEANVSCWTPQVDFVDAGSCLLLLASDTSRFQQLDQILHSVGIFSFQSEINALPFTITQVNNQFAYQIILPENIEVTAIQKIEIIWGDDTPVKFWFKGSVLDINNYLQAVHAYTDAGHMLVTLKIILDDGSEWQGLRNIYMSEDIVPVKDTIPDAFVFSAVDAVPLAEFIISPAITITGINAATKITINSGEYSIDGGDFRSTDGLITNDQAVVIKLLSSENHNKSTEALLTVGSLPGAFNITTIAASPEPDVVIPEPDVVIPEPDVVNPEPDIVNSEPDAIEGSGSAGGGVFNFSLYLLLSLLGIRTLPLRRSTLDN